MLPTPEFKKRLARGIRLFIRETRDGCVECRAVGTCHEHGKVFLDVSINPRKYIKIDGGKR